MPLRRIEGEKGLKIVVGESEGDAKKALAAYLELGLNEEQLNLITTDGILTLAEENDQDISRKLFKPEPDKIIIPEVEFIKEIARSRHQ